MRPVDPSTALRDIADQLPALHAEVTGLRDEARRSRRKIGWLTRASILVAAIAIGAIAWTAYQQTVLDSKSAAIAALVHQNAADAARDARNAHNLCVRLNRSRAVIAGVWPQVQFRPGADPAALLAKVEAAEPLGNCPKGPSAGR